jgi:hypothetical protein
MGLSPSLRQEATDGIQGAFVLERAKRGMTHFATQTI